MLDLNTIFLQSIVLERFGIDFWGGQGSIFDDFSKMCRTSWLTLGMFSAALAGEATPPTPPDLDMVFVVLG